MKSTAKNPLRQLNAITLAAVALCGPWVAAPAAAAICTWVPASGNWGLAGNWSCGAVPQGPTGDTANIGAGKVVVINDLGPTSVFRSVFTLNQAGTLNLDAFGLTLQDSGSTSNTGTINVGGVSTAALQLSSAHTFTNTGGVVNIGNGSVLNQFGASFIGGTIATTGTGMLAPNNSAANILSGVTLNGTLNLASGGQTRENIQNGMTLNGVVNLNNSSYLAFNGTQTLGGTGSIVFGNGTNGTGFLGVDGSNTTLTIAGGMTVRGAAGVIGDQLQTGGGGGRIVNQGLISSDGGGTITLRALSNGLSNTGTVQATGAGSVLSINNINVANAGGTLRALNGGVLLHAGGTISGGTLTSSGGGVLQATNDSGNFLDGVTMNGTFNMATGAQTRESVIGGMSLNGTINLGNSSLLAFRGTQTLSGSGSIVFGDGTGGAGFLGVDGTNPVLTIGSNVVVRGQSGVIGDQLIAGGGGGSLVNNGRISSDVAAGSIILRGLASGITNNGIIEAQNGGNIRLQSNVAGAAGGQIRAGTGSVVLQEGVTLSGAINTSGGGSFQPSNSNGNFLDAVTFAGILNMATGSQVRNQIVNGLSLGGTINLNNSSYLAFNGTQTLSGTGSIVFGDGTNGTGFLSVDGTSPVLTIASGIAVRGANGVVGEQGITGGGGNSLINNGRISADVAGGTIILRGLASGATNNGVMEAQNGGTLRLQSNVTGAAGSQILSGAGSLVIQENSSLSGAISVSGGGSFQPNNSNANFLNGVTFTGVLNMATGSQVRDQVVNGLTLSGATVNLNNTSYLAFQGSQTLGGTGSIVFGDGTNGAGYLSVDGAGSVLTIASGVTVRGQNGVVGEQTITGGGTNRLINQGLIAADSGGTITVRGLASGLANSNILRATGSGSVLNLNGVDIDNGAGTINAQNNGVVLHSSGRITGGVISSSTGGAFQATNSNGNFLDGVSLTGVLNLATGAQTRERINNGLTNNGTINLNNSSYLNFEGTQSLGGTGSVVFGDGSNGLGSLGVDGANTVLTIAAGATVRGQNGTIGDQSLVGGGANRLINNGTINADGGGTITLRNLAAGIANNGTLRAQNGTLAIAGGQGGLTGTGSLQVDAGGTLNLSNNANVQGRLIMGATGATLNIGTGNLTITNDYTNVAAGSGNSFAKRAGVNGSGLIVAGGDVAQVITGAAVSNGATANAALTIGNVRVGTTTFNYRLANTGTNGPTLRGAIQTSVNGANLTDARLSGAGVTAANYSAGAPGSNSGDLGVSFAVAAAGPIAALNGQVLNYTSNFSNIPDQKLAIVVGAGAAAYNGAVGQATPSPVVLAAQRVGGNLSVPLTVANVAAAGAYSEDLNAAFSGFTGSASGSGSIAGRIAGTSNTGSGSMSVALNTSTSGAKSGSAVIVYQTAGAVAGASNGLGVAAAGTQTINVSGNVYAPAVAQLGTPSVSFGIVRVGDSVAPAHVSVSNTASGALTDTLRATLSGGASPFSAGGTASGIAAGGLNTSSLTVGLNTSAAGIFNSSALVSYTSQNPEMADLALGTSTVTLAAQVNNLAATTLAKNSGAGSFSGAALSYTLNFGTVQLGGSGGQAILSLSNSASGPADALSGSFDLSALQPGDPFSLSGFSSFNALAAGSSIGGLTVGFNGASAGSFDRVIVLNRLSTNGSGPDLTLASVQLHLQGNVTAVPEPGAWAMWLAGLGLIAGFVRRRLALQRM